MIGKPIAVLDSQDDVICIGLVAGVVDFDELRIMIVESTADYEANKTYNFNKNNVRFSFNPSIIMKKKNQ
ncbi:hypothetical protein ACOBQJ_03630 [Pelotomaculum propionicicum]|uniref:hypothetical protein n=1 Tax=Pelotomaculum propionicicum TaxID=258475 RepID=UPI003B81E5DA